MGTCFVTNDRFLHFDMDVKCATKSLQKTTEPYRSDMSIFDVFKKKPQPVKKQIGSFTFVREVNQQGMMTAHGTAFCMDGDEFVLGFQIGRVGSEDIFCDLLIKGQMPPDCVGSCTQDLLNGFDVTTKIIHVGDNLFRGRIQNCENLSKALQCVSLIREVQLGLLNSNDLYTAVDFPAIGLEDVIKELHSA